MNELTQFLEDTLKVSGDPALTQKTHVTMLTVAIREAKTTIENHLVNLKLLYALLQQGFLECDESGFEYCPICDQSRAKGHAETCLWEVLLEDACTKS